MNASYPISAEERAWLDTAPVGREFGSPQYEALMEHETRAAIEAMRAFPKVPGVSVEAAKD